MINRENHQANLSRPGFYPRMRKSRLELEIENESMGHGRSSRDNVPRQSLRERIQAFFGRGATFANSGH